MEVKNLIGELKNWYALSCPTTGVRFDARTLELLDADHDGRVRSPEILAALEFMKKRGVELGDLMMSANPGDARRLEEMMAQADHDVDEERYLRYKLNLGELLQNYVSMERLYGKNTEAIFQAGTLYIDGRSMSLCFNVADEAAHSALVGKSNCCVIYLKASRKEAENVERLICAAVTAGKVGTLYAGLNGVFYDADGKDWEATITQVVENQVSLEEAFWAPWKKIGESVSGIVKKMLDDRQKKGTEMMLAGTPAGGTPANNGQMGGAAMASSVAAIGIGVGMVGAAAASVISAIKGLHPWWMIFVAIAAMVLVVSLPSVVLAYIKLRRRDIGAILNASGWAVNRPLKFSMSMAKRFTKCRGIFK